jgi:pimeloyl-ACP methyl ester carboxylesterase
MLPDDDPVLGGLQASAVRAPTLVMHGSADPLFPFAHGEALTRAIPNARLIVLDGVGHEVPPRAVWPMVVPELIRHTEAIGD